MNFRIRPSHLMLWSLIESRGMETIEEGDQFLCGHLKCGVLSIVFFFSALLFSPPTMTSKRNVGNNAAAAIPPPPIQPSPRNYCDDQGVRVRWPVLIYRFQSHRGWEVYADGASERRAPPPSSGNNAPPAGGDGGRGGASAEELTAAPREGCIEVRKMRLRIRLFQQHVPWDADRPSSSTSARGDCGDEGRGDSDVPGSDGWNDNALLVRRRNTLLVTTRRGRGAVVFRFLSTRDCVDFCDRLVHLNRRVLLAPPRRLRDGGGGGDVDDAVDDADASSRKWAPDCRALPNGAVVAADERRRELLIDEANGAKRRCLAATLGDRDAGDSSHRRECIVNYIVQLAHSEEFRGFVDEIERGLECAPDTAAIHAALGLR